MKKYYSLYKYLKNLETDSVELSFEEIEKILGFKLPDSAFKFRPWWGNDYYHSQSGAWLDAGWKITNIALGRTVKFQRIAEVGIKNKESSKISFNYKLYTNKRSIKSDYYKLFPEESFIFIADYTKKKILVEKYEDAKKSFNNKYWKGVFYEVWGIIELLLKYIIEINKNQSEKICEIRFFTKDLKKLDCWKLIKVTKELGFLTDDSEKAAESLKNLRNIIHPDYQISNKIEPDEEKALLSISFLRTIIKDLKRNKDLWLSAAQQYYNNKEYENSEEAYDVLINMDNNNLDYLKSLADVQYFLKKYFDSISNYEKIKNKNPSYIAIDHLINITKIKLTEQLEIEKRNNDFRDSLINKKKGFTNGTW